MSSKPGWSFGECSVNTSVADNGKKTNEPLTSPQYAAQAFPDGQTDKEPFREKSRNFMHPCKHKLMV